MENDPAGAEVGATFKSIIKQADPFRPVVAAMNNAWGIGLSNVLDIFLSFIFCFLIIWWKFFYGVVDAQGINYNYGQYNSYHASHPYQPIFGSETASCTG